MIKIKAKLCVVDETDEEFVFEFKDIEVEKIEEGNLKEDGKVVEEWYINKYKVYANNGGINNE